MTTKDYLPTFGALLARNLNHEPKDLPIKSTVVEPLSHCDVFLDQISWHKSTCSRDEEIVRDDPEPRCSTSTPTSPEALLMSLPISRYDGHCPSTTENLTSSVSCLPCLPCMSLKHSTTCFPRDSQPCLTAGENKPRNDSGRGEGRCLPHL